jgi:hypothetical protein
MRARRVSSPRPGGANKLLALSLWIFLGLLFLSWAALLWHPWIDWFGRPR